MKGSYVLLIYLDRDRNVHIGRLGKISFKKGFYTYIGSALNGLDQRIKRHIRKDKKVHWHIDFFLKYGKVIEVFYKEGQVSKECNIAKIFNEKLLSIPKFGSSDCRCMSHLFYGELALIRDLIKQINMNKYSFNANT